MNLDIDALKELDYKQVIKNAGGFFARNRFIVSSVLILSVSAFVLLHISMLIRPEVDLDYLESQTQTQEEIEFAADAIDRLKELNDSRIEIESEFSDRNNPFSDN